MKIDRNKVAVLVAVGLVALVGGLVYAGHIATAGYDADNTVACLAGDAACSGACSTCPLAAEGKCPSAAATINPDKCVNCLRCVQVAPEAYELDAATQTVRIKPDAPAEAIERGAKACPVHAVQH